MQTKDLKSTLEYFSVDFINNKFFIYQSKEFKTVVVSKSLVVRTLEDEVNVLIEEGDHIICVEGEELNFYTVVGFGSTRLWVNDLYHAICEPFEPSHYCFYRVHDAIKFLEYF